MAQLKDLLVSGVSRFVGKLFADEVQLTTLNIPTASNGTTYGPGTSGQVLATNNNSVYWKSLTIADIGGSTVLPVSLGGTGATVATKGGVVYGTGTTYGLTAAGTSGYLLQSGGTGTPTWINATNANTASTIVKRDANGNFSAGTITATLSGNASTANALNFSHTNELFLGVNGTTQTRVWINYRRTINGATSGNTAITEYRFGNSNGGTSGVTLYADSFTGNAATASAFSSGATVTLTGDTTGQSAASTKSWSVTTKTDRLSTVGDNRGVATTPNDYANKIIFQGLKTNSSFGSPSTDTYSYVVGLRGWNDSSGGNSHELAFNNSGIFRRDGATTSWNAWKKILDSGNYTDYTVTKTGSGASGTWGINISGNAATASKLGTASAGSATQPIYWANGIPHSLTGTIANDISGNAATSTWTTLIKPIASTTTASASTWSIPTGSKQVWGERFSDSTLKYTPSGGSETTVTDTGDLVLFLTPSATSNLATLNMKIDGTYYGSFSGSLSGNASTASKANAANISTNTNGVAYYTNTSGTFGNIRSTNGAFYSTGTDVKPVFGTLPIAQGGTGKTTALDAITNLGGPYLLANGIQIPASANLDSGYKAMGTYYSPDSTRSQSLGGTVPFTGSGFKMITMVGYRAATLRQFAGGADDNLYYRSSQDTGSTWTKWYRFVRLPSGSDNKTFAAIGGATTPVYVNASGIITACTAYSGASVLSASKFTAAQSITLTGDVTGTASSVAGWSIATTLANSGVTAASYGPSANASPSHGGTFSVPYLTVDAKGRITAASTKTITLPADSNTDTKVTQTNTTDSADYRILFSGNANDTNETTTVRKNTNLKYNPSTKNLQLTSGILTLGTSHINQATTTGTATAAADSGASASPNRYKPALWKFNYGIVPVTGDTIVIKTPGVGHDYGTWLSLDNGTTYHPICTWQGTSHSRVTTHFPAGSYLYLVYDANQVTDSVFESGGSDARKNITGSWCVVNFYDANTTRVWELYKAYGHYTAQSAINRYQIIFSALAPNQNKLISLFDTDNNLSTGKTLLTTEFDPLGEIFYYYSSGVYAANATVDAGRLNYTALADLRYTFNITNDSSVTATTAFRGVSPNRVYLRVTINHATGGAKVDGNQPLVTALPTSADGKYYIYLGNVYDWYRIYLNRDHPVYFHDGVRIVQYKGHSIGTNFLDLRGTASATMTAASTNPQIIFSEQNGTQPVHLIYSDYDNYRSPAGLKVIGGASATPAWFEVEGNIYAAAFKGTADVATKLGTSNVGSTYVPIHLVAGTATQCSSPSLQVNLASTSAANVFAQSPRPGVTGVLGLANGGTGQTSAAGVFSALSWTAGTTAGPTLSITIVGQTRTATIPSASATASGIVTTGTQTFRGRKQFGYLDFFGRNDSGGAVQYVGDIYYRNNAGTQVAEIWYDTGNATNITKGQFYWREFSPNSTANTATTGYHETYSLPAVTAGLTANKSYSILTTKSTLTVAQGGTGKTTAAGIFEVVRDNGGNSTWVNISGDTMTGTLKIKGLKATSGTDYGTALPTSGAEGQVFFQISNEQYELPEGGASGTLLIKASDSDRDVTWTSSAVHVADDVLYGAAWNDYAEYRKTTTPIEAGRVVIENGDDTLSLSTERMQPGAEIVSDTFGFAIGQTEKTQTPIAATGRVLAYPNEPRETYKPGQPVCSGPNGTVSQMTNEEAREYPWMIIGTVSAIPDYDTWGEGNVKVNGRIWIRIR